MFETQPVSNEGQHWEEQSWYERVQHGLETEAAVEGLSEDEVLERRLAESGIVAHLVSSPDIIRQRRTAKFLNRLISRY